MSFLAQIPIEYDRRFSIHLYWVSHGPLLLRSFDANASAKRIDILFYDVRWMALPVWFEGLRIERGVISDLPIPLTEKIKEEAHFMTVFRLISQGVTHFVLASDGVLIGEDDKSYAEDSPLLPYFRFRAFHELDDSKPNKASEPMPLTRHGSS